MDYIPIKKSLADFYIDFPLFYQTKEKEFILYKPAGKKLDSNRLNDTRHPPLFLNQNDRLSAITNLQQKFNGKLSENITSGNTTAVKETLCNLVEETLSEPRSGALKALPETINIMVSGYSDHPEVLKAFATISFKDYTTVIHSVNVMALTMGFCFYSDYTDKETKRLSLSALLHDIGKTQIPLEILTAQRKLSKKEFDIMRSHTTVGAQIIKENSSIDDSAALGAIEHHEKLDGSGYPKGTKDISFDGQLLSIIDCYEALTNEDRPYRRAKKPIDTLLMLKDDLLAGKFDKVIFENLCRSLL